MAKLEASFGLVLPTYAGDSTGRPDAETYWGLYDMPLNDEVSWERVLRTAREAESLGYDSLWTPDHFMLGTDGETFECWTVLSALSQVTSKAKLGSFVTCNMYRNPALMSKMAASLGVISANRLILGYGTGWYEREFRAYGYDFWPPKERVDAMEEGLQVISGMMSSKKFSFKGHYYRTEEAVNNPKPALKVPLMVGGWGKRVIGLAAKYADAWDIGTYPTPGEYSERVDFLKSELAKNGRSFEDFRRSMSVQVLIAKNEEELAEKRRRIMRVLDALGPKIVQLPSAGYKFELDKAVVGTPEQVRARLREYVDLGCQQFLLMFMDYPKYDSVELFASTMF